MRQAQSGGAPLIPGEPPLRTECCNVDIIDPDEYSGNCPECGEEALLQDATHEALMEKAERLNDDEKESS